MDKPVEPDGPLLTFYRFIEEARLPQRADRSAGGSIPTRGFRYCEPVTTASAFGWYVFPPMSFSLMWDGGTDRWFGPLFTNIRLTRTNMPIEFDANFPFLQVQPIHRSSYGAALDDVEIVTDLGELAAEDWDAFRATVVKPIVENPERQPGH